MATTYRDQGIVLLARPYKDNDRLYSVYTREHGKVVMVAIGSRRTKSKMSPHMSAFGVVDMLVAQGKRMDKLAGATLVTTWREVGARAESSIAAQTFLLLVDALTRNAAPDVRVFSLIEDFYAVLDTAAGAGIGERDGARQRPLFFDAALFQLFDVLGFGIELGVCVKCRGGLTEQGLRLNIVKGGVSCVRCPDPMGMEVTVAAVKALRFFRSEKVGLSMLLRLSNEVRREVAFLLEVMVSTHVHWHFPAMAYLGTLRRD